MKFLRDIHNKLDSILEAVKALGPQKDDSRALMRDILGSIDWSDIPPENVEAEINQIGPVAGLLLNMCKRLTLAQEHFTTSKAQDWYQACFGRGTVNGIELLREKFESLQASYEERTRPQPAVDPYNPLPQ